MSLGSHYATEVAVITLRCHLAWGKQTFYFTPCSIPHALCHKMTAARPNDGRSPTDNEAPWRKVL